MFHERHEETLDVFNGQENDPDSQAVVCNLDAGVMQSKRSKFTGEDRSRGRC